VTIKLRSDTLLLDRCPGGAANAPGLTDRIGVDVTEFRPSPSFPRLMIGSDGEIIGPSGRQLRHFPDKRGYRRVNVYLGARSWKQLGVHFLVCEAFHGPRPAGKLVAHGDGNPANNRADNLRWATHRQNEADKVKHGTRMWCDRHHQAKLTDDQAREVRDRRRAGEALRTLATEFGISKQQVWAIGAGKAWVGLK
jgi:hypothetical protein